VKYVMSLMCELEHAFPSFPFHGIGKTLAAGMASQDFTEELCTIDVATSSLEHQWAQAWTHVLLQVKSSPSTVEIGLLKGFVACTMAEMNLKAVRLPKILPKPSNLTAPVATVEAAEASSLSLVAAGADGGHGLDHGAQPQPEAPETHIVPVTNLYRFLTKTEEEMLSEFGQLPNSEFDAVPAFWVSYDAMSMQFLHMVRLWLEMELYKLEFVGCLDERPRHQCFHLDVASKPRKLFCKVEETSGSFVYVPQHLHFVGEVSLQKGSAGVLLCAIRVGKGKAKEKHFAIGLYIRGEKMKDLGACCPVLAWFAQTASDSGQANAERDSIKRTLSLPSNLIASQDTVVPFDVMVPVLVLDSDAIKKSAQAGMSEILVAPEPKKRKNRTTAAATTIAAVDVLAAIGAEALCARFSVGDAATGRSGRAKPKTEWAHLLR